MGNISVAAVERIIRAAGGTRVSREAAETLAVILEQKGMEIASKAAKLARHAGRKTITAEDIRLAQ
ncbi:MAG: NFYB/HAP3 family transcription factor subunit [Candidatus Micrarchaeota archaeon]|nr:NFYB/HAP3 family transcription factor subunit [Candidatus Micrarchaeota archaeon]